MDGGARGSPVDSCFRCGWKRARTARYAGYRSIAHWLALCCFLAARRTARSVLLRRFVGLTAVIFLTRGLLVVPFIVAGQREWRTPIGKFIVTGDWFAVGSLAVLAIGALMGLGIYQTRERSR